MKLCKLSQLSILNLRGKFFFNIISSFTRCPATGCLNLKFAYRVFHLDSTPFILQVEQHELYSCSIDCLSKKLQGPCNRLSNFIFSKNVRWFTKKSNLRTKNGRDVSFSQKCDKFNVAFLVKEIRGIGGVVRET